MPQIIVTADQTGDRGEGVVMLRERVNIADFDSEHFANMLVERLGWAVGDAHDAERDRDANLEQPDHVATPEAVSHARATPAASS